MPKNKFQDVIFTLIMVVVMVYAMVIYNISLDTGKLTNQVFLMAFGELPIMGIVAFFLELFIVGPLAKKLAFRLVQPGMDKMIFIVLAISAITVCLMCPLMSLAAAVLFKGAPICIGTEVFGFSCLPYFAVVCTVSRLCSGNRSMYGKQKPSPLFLQK